VKQILLLATTVAVFALLTHPAQAQARTGTTNGDLQGNLSILNLFGEQPETMRQLYSAAYAVLASDLQARFADVAADPAIRRLCKENAILHFGGPMLGSVAADGAKIWVRTAKPAKVEVLATVNGQEKSYGPLMTSDETDLTAVVPVTGLPPNTRCPYRVLIDGTPIDIPGHAAINTAPEPSRTGKVRIVFGSCFHRWGLGNNVLADRIRGRDPVALLLIGDIAVQDRNNHLGLHRADYLLRDCHPAWRSLVASIPVYATWDDHDYFDNDKAGIPPGFTGKDRAGVHRVFVQAWVNPSYGFCDDRGGVFLRTRIGPCDIVMLDNRYFRTGQNGSFLGEEQMQWLEKQLLDCQGPFIILSCGTMWSDYVSSGKDSWGRWDPDGRARIFRLMEKSRIGGVLLISGDRHGARGFRIPRPGGFAFYEFGTACLGARTGPPVTDPEWTTQLYGIEGKYAFGEFTVDATIADPEVAFRLIQEDGAELYALTLTRSQLTPCQ
jgi:alkaline phosphatase D